MYWDLDQGYWFRQQLFLTQHHHWFLIPRRFSHSMGKAGASRKSIVTHPSWETLSQRLSKPIAVPLMTAVQGTCGVPAPLLTAVLSWRWEEEYQREHRLHYIPVTLIIHTVTRWCLHVLHYELFSEFGMYSHETSVEEWIYLIVHPLCGPGSIPDRGGLFQGIIPRWYYVPHCMEVWKGQRLGPRLKQR